MKPKCPKDNCKNDAIVDITYGILPCASCQAKDADHAELVKPEFYNASKASRIQAQRDKHGADTLQPWLPGKDMKPNPDFVKKYPKQAENYFDKEQLSKL